MSVNYAAQTNTLLEIGSKIYWKLKRKKDKAIEVHWSIRGDMRCLAHSELLFKEERGIAKIYQNSMDMFCRENLDFLYTVIDIYTKNEDDSVKAQAVPLLSVKKTKRDRYAVFTFR